MTIRGKSPLQHSRITEQVCVTAGRRTPRPISATNQLVPSFKISTVLHDVHDKQLLTQTINHWHPCFPGCSF